MNIPSDAIAAAAAVSDIQRNSEMRDEIQSAFCLFTHTCVAHYTLWARTTVHSGEMKPTSECDNSIHVGDAMEQFNDRKFSSVILWFGGAFIPFRFSMWPLLPIHHQNAVVLRAGLCDCMRNTYSKCSIVYVSIPVDGGVCVCVRWMLIAQQYCLAIRIAVCNDI